MTIEEKLAEISDSLMRLAEHQFMMTMQEEIALSDLLFEAHEALLQDMEDHLADPPEPLTIEQRVHRLFD